MNSSSTSIIYTKSNPKKHRVSFLHLMGTATSDPWNLGYVNIKYYGS